MNSQPAGQWLNVPEELVRADFDRRPFLIRHELGEHPLLKLPRIIELAQVLPASSVEYNAGDLPVNQHPDRTPRTGLSIADTLYGIEQCRSWMVLKHIEQDAQYAALVDQCLDQFAPALRGRISGMHTRHGFIFVSSPGAVTPFHVDYEYNFLLQIRGGKCITIFDGNDRELMSEPVREAMVGGAHRNLEYRDEFAAKGMAFELAPGLGVHVPLTAPHWVKVRDEVSISLSITFMSNESDRVRGAHSANAMLRKLGWNPLQVGTSPMLDSAKHTVHRIIRKLRRVTARAQH